MKQKRIGKERVNGHTRNGRKRVAGNTKGQRGEGSFEENPEHHQESEGKGPNGLVFVDLRGLRF